MAKKKGRGLIDRLMMGKEKSEEYARSSLPSNRWELFWDIFKGKFWKLVLLSLLISIFFIPLGFLFFFRYLAIVSNGTLYPFAQMFGIGYQAPTAVVGFAENIVYNVNMSVFIFMPLAVLFASIGISGGAYVMRNVVWAEGNFMFQDFWHGVKANFKQVFLIGLLFSLIFYFTMTTTSFVDQLIVTDQGAKWLLYTSKIISIVTLIYFGFMTAHMFSMCVTYECKLRSLIKNSFLLTLGLLPFNILFGLICILPFFLLTLNVIWVFVGCLFIALLWTSVMFLIWTNFCQWAYDNSINSKIGVQRNRGIYEKVKATNSKTLEQYKSQVAYATPIYAKPIKPITDDEIKLVELPTSFSRDDLRKLNESKQAIYEEDKKYVEEHQNDEEFVKAKEQELSNEEERQKRIERAKRELAKRKRK